MDGCTLVALKVMHIVVKRTQCYVKVILSSNFALHPIQEILTAYSKMKIVSKKKNPLFVWGWDRKICPSGSPFVISQQASYSIVETEICLGDNSILCDDIPPQMKILNMASPILMHFLNFTLNQSVANCIRQHYILQYVTSLMTSKYFRQ